MAEVALVGRSRARRLRERERRAGPGEIERRDNRFGRRADGRDDDGLRPVARELAEDMRRLGRGEGDDRIGGKDWSGNRCGGFVGGPAARQVNGEDGSFAGLEPFERGQRKAFERRLESCADDGVEDEIGVERGIVLGEVFRRLDDVDEAMRGAGEFLPGAGRIAGQLVARA